MTETLRENIISADTLKRCNLLDQDMKRFVYHDIGEYVTQPHVHRDKLMKLYEWEMIEFKTSVIELKERSVRK